MRFRITYYQNPRKLHHNHFEDQQSRLQKKRWIIIRPENKLKIIKAGWPKILASKPRRKRKCEAYSRKLITIVKHIMIMFWCVNRRYILRLKPWIPLQAMIWKPFRLRLLSKCISEIQIHTQRQTYYRFSYRRFSTAIFLLKIWWRKPSHRPEAKGIRQ